MARYTGPKHKLARREGVNILDKTSNSLMRRLNVPPGVHGKKNKRRLSEFGQQLREKQKAKATYGLLERQFKKLVETVSLQKGDTEELMIAHLETRLDNMVYRLKLAKSRMMARQFVSHGHVLVNGKKMTIPSFKVRVGQTIALSDQMRDNTQVKKSLEGDQTLPEWLERKATVGKVLRIPNRDEMEQAIDEQMIVEYYSR